MLHHNRTKPEPQPRRWPADEPKPKLPAVQLPIFRVHYTALEDYLAKVYQMHGYDFLTTTGAKPGMVPEYQVEPELPVTWNARNQADKIRAGQRTRNISLILTVLCVDGFIPAGTYIIDTRPTMLPIKEYRMLLETTCDPLSPECVRFRETHHGDAGFMKQAASLDQAVLEWLRQQENGAP